MQVHNSRAQLFRLSVRILRSSNVKSFWPYTLEAICKQCKECCRTWRHLTSDWSWRDALNLLDRSMEERKRRNFGEFSVDVIIAPPPASVMSTSKKTWYAYHSMIEINHDPITPRHTCNTPAEIYHNHRCRSFENCCLRGRRPFCILKAFALWQWFGDTK